MKGHPERSLARTCATRSRRICPFSGQPATAAFAHSHLKCCNKHMTLPAHRRMPSPFVCHSRRESAFAVAPSALRHTFIAFAFLLTSICPAQFPPSLLHGQVIDPTGVPIANATIAIGVSQTYTDTSGNFTLPAPHGNATLTATFQGLRASVDLHANQSEVHLQLEPFPLQQTATVTTTRSAIGIITDTGTTDTLDLLRG